MIAGHVYPGMNRNTENLAEELLRIAPGIPSGLRDTLENGTGPMDMGAVPLPPPDAGPGMTNRDGPANHTGPEWRHRRSC